MGLQCPHFIKSWGAAFMPGSLFYPSGIAPGSREGLKEGKEGWAGPQGALYPR